MTVPLEVERLKEVRLSVDESMAVLKVTSMVVAREMLVDPRVGAKLLTSGVTSALRLVLRVKELLTAFPSLS